MPEVTVKLANKRILTAQQRRDVGRQLQMTVADVLSVGGTQAEWRSEKVEVDFLIASPDACMNGLKAIIKVEANQYPERAGGRAQEFSDMMKSRLQQNLFFPMPNDHWNIWVRLAEGGWS